MLPARDNPFAVHRVLRERYRLDEAGWAALLARLGKLSFRAAIVGPHGAGKTTLLEDLAARLEVAGWRVHWVRLSEEVRVVPAEFLRVALPGLGARDVVLLDGGEQLSAPAWWLFRWKSRRAGGVVISTHREGRLPTLRRCATTPEVLRELVNSLGASLSEADARALHRRHRGNIREALRALYDASAARG